MSPAGQAIGSAGSDIHLKVELVSFTAEARNDQVRLYWETSSEKNNAYFMVEKSLDGINFSSISQLTGMGNSSSLQKYVWIDEHPFPAAVSFYRLKQVAHNGQFLYSAVKEINTAR